MTFDQIRSEVLERMSLSSADASTRVGAAINRHYKRITSLLGMETTRYLSTDVVMTPGVRTATVPGVEKVDRVADITSQLRPLTEVSLHQMRTLEPTTSAPQVWALSHTQAQAIVLMFDTFPDFAWTLRIDGWTTLTDLTGTGEPAFPASFHDILTWFVLAEELLRKEKSPLAQAYEQKALGLLEDLRFHLADTHTRTLRQGTQPGGATGGSGQGGGGGAPGGAQYLTNIPPGTVVGRASDQGTGNSQPITTGPHLAMTGSVLDAVGYVDKTGTPVVGQVAVFTDADTVAGYTGLGFGVNPGVLTISGGYNYTVLILDETTQPANARQFRLINTDGALSIGAYTDLGGQQTINLRLTRDGLVHLDSGRLRFPSTQIPSANPYTFDDYREIAWTPILTAASGASGQAYTAQEGWYVKSGRSFVGWFFLGLSTLGTLSGTVQIGGLPFPSSPFSNTGGLFVEYFVGLTAPITFLSGHIYNGTQVIDLYHLPTAGATGMAGVPSSLLSNSFTIHGYVSYMTAN